MRAQSHVRKYMFSHPDLFSQLTTYDAAFGREFGHEMSDQKFARKVARLNSNVLHLCFTQNTNTRVLHPMHTLQNLMHLLNTEITDLGR